MSAINTTSGTTGSGIILPPGFSIPEGSGSKKSNLENDSISFQIKALQQELLQIQNDIKVYKNQITEYSSEMKKDSNKNIEVIGIFASVLALIIIDANIILAAKSIISAILLIIGMTCAMSIFAILIHIFFNDSPKNAIKKSFWIPMSILIIILFIGVYYEHHNSSQQIVENHQHEVVIKSLNTQISPENITQDSLLKNNHIQGK